jgi:beta-lactamase regulating signal transducer with metallopeptidase domain
VNTMLTQLQQWAVPALWTIERASIIGLIVFALAWIICTAAPSLPPAIKCWVWRLAFLKLLISVASGLAAPLPILHASPPAPVQPAYQLPPDDAVRSFPSALAPNPIVPISTGGSTQSLYVELLIMSIWAAGVLIGSISFFARWLWTRGIRRRCIAVIDGPARATYLQVSARMSVRRPPPLLQSSKVDSPLLLGVVRPVIIIPNLFMDTDESSLRMMLAHDLTHFVRQDTRWAILTTVSRIIFWFHPGVVWAHREMDAWREIACDDTAITATGSAVPEYARMLVDVVAASSRRIPILAVGVVRSRSTIHRRLVAMQHFNSWSSRRRILVAGVVAAVGACAVIPWKLTAQQTTVSERLDKPATRPAHSALATEGADPSLPQVDAVGWVLTDAATMRASLDGVVKVLCKPGDRVKSGQLLAHIDTAVLEAEVAKAQLALKKDQMNLNMEKKLGRGNISQSQVADTELTVASDEAELRLKTHQLDSARTLALLGGVVSEVTVHQGEFVTKGQPLLTVVSVSDPKVNCDFPATLYPKLHVGQYVEFSNAAHNEPFPGHIDFISPMADSRTQTVQVRASMDDPGGELHPGLTGRVSVWLPK